MGSGIPNAAGGAAAGQPPAGAAPQADDVDDNKLAQCIERALGYTVDTTDFDADGHAAVQDLLVAALGVGKVEMETITETQPVINPITNEPVMVLKGTMQPVDDVMMQQPDFDPESIEPATQEVIADQYCRLRHFSWSQFHWEPVQNWSQCSWVAFDHWMTKKQIESKFKVTLDTEGGTESGAGVVGGDPKKPQAAKYKDLFCVHEIWDKKKKQRLFIAEAFTDGVLDQEDDPLGLQDFFPNPKPMFLNLRGDDLVPMPDYTFCAALFQQCNELSNRVGLMIKQIRDVGLYDSSVAELAMVKGNPPDGTLIPVNGLAARIAQAGGKADGTINSVLARWDNSTTVNVLNELLQTTEVFKQRIFEIYGVPDIIRGSTDPNETASAQQIKAQWADVRIGEKVRIVALFFRDVFRIMAEIMAERFETDVLEKMTGITLNPAEIQVLRSDYGRCYAIDVESDSTMVQDEAAEQEQRMSMLNAISTFAEKLLPAVQQNVLPADLAKEMLLTGLGAFKFGRQLEQSINNLPGTIQQLGQQQQQIGNLSQQLKQANEMAAQLQKQIQGFNAQKEQRENVKAMSDVQSKAVGNQKTQADTEHTQVLTAAEAQDIRHRAMEPIPLPEPNVVQIHPKGAA